MIGVPDSQLHQEIDDAKRIRYQYYCQTVECIEKIRQHRNDEHFIRWAIKLKNKVNKKDSKK